MKKVRYELDPHNRLVIGIPGFRQVLDGQFRVGKYNELSYDVKAPLSQGADIPHQVKLKGEWSLTANHKLRFTLNKWGRQTFGDKLTFEGGILDASADRLLFAVTTTTKAGTRSAYVLNLSGSWKADNRNRLSFYVKREKGASDILTFNGAWQIDKANRIIYRYESSSLIKKKSRVNTLTFNGRWDIKDRLRVSYSLGGDTDSSFEFKAGLGLFSKDYIKYSVGIGLTGRIKPVNRTITLYGTWNFKKARGLSFEIGRSGDKTHAIIFSADARLTDNDTVSLRLRRAADSKDLGATLELSRRLFRGEGELFLRALTSHQEAALTAGAAFRW